MNPELLKSLFDYRDGVLYWKQDCGNKSKAGTAAGYLCKSSGYQMVGINRKQYLAHRIVFAWHNGYMPTEIDHIDGNPLNNAIENLRESSREANMQNTKLRSDNKSGVKGVMWHKTNKKWAAVVKCNGKINHIGYFADLETAAEAVRVARLNLHKEYANHG